MQKWLANDLTDASKILTLASFKMILFLSCTYWWWKVVSCIIGKQIFCCTNKLTPHLTFWKANLHPEKSLFADAIIEHFVLTGYIFIYMYMHTLLYLRSIFLWKWIHFYMTSILLFNHRICRTRVSKRIFQPITMEYEWPYIPWELSTKWCSQL